jgi:hypothetical protein
MILVSRAMVLVFLLAGLMSCVPSQVKYDYVSLPQSQVQELSAPFLKDLSKVGVKLETGAAYRYDGSDDRAFLATIDRFYLENPGFCPVENGFFFLEDRQLYLTLAAKDLQVRAFIYDQSLRPKLIFAFINASSATKLPVTPCQTAKPSAL